MVIPAEKSTPARRTYAFGPSRNMTDNHPGKAYLGDSLYSCEYALRMTVRLAHIVTHIVDRCHFVTRTLFITLATLNTNDENISVLTAIPIGVVLS